MGVHKNLVGNLEVITEKEERFKKITETTPVSREKLYREAKKAKML